LDLLYPYLAVKHQDFYQKMRNHGVKIQFVVYDLLAILLPQYVAKAAPKAHSQWLKIVAQSDGVICISKSVAEELKGWLINDAVKTSQSFEINWFHLGVDSAFNSSYSDQSLCHEKIETLNLLKSRSSFLCVSTIEPRKGHAQTLAAFEILWSQGNDINLVFVGKQGWLVDELIGRLEDHPEIGKRLFWFKEIDDDYLGQIYKCCACLIAASEGEGFGLPLIEAAHQGMPIIARSIPIFHEVASEYAYYFEGKHPQNLALAITEWIKLAAIGKQPSSKNMPWLSWAQSAKQLEKALHLDQPPFRAL
jgi:glycosyltransferase involved in cell wall biosynthesis